MNEFTLSALFVNDDNLPLALRTHGNRNLLPTPNNPSSRIEAGTVIVTRTINCSDLFDDRFGTRHEDIWICTRAEFDCMFDVIDDTNRTETFALIKTKK